MTPAGNCTPLNRFSFLNSNKSFLYLYIFIYIYTHIFIFIYSLFLSFVEGGKNLLVIKGKKKGTKRQMGVEGG